MGYFNELLEIWREGTALGTLYYIRHKLALRTKRRQSPIGRMHRTQGIGILGAGTYPSTIHLPLLHRHGEALAAIASRSGASAASLATLYHIDAVYYNLEEFWHDTKITSYLIATPPYLHPPHIIRAAASGKYTYCEKPVAIDKEGLQHLEQDSQCQQYAHRIMVGFNRRFAPAVRQLLALPWMQARHGPMEVHYRVNFGPKIKNTMSDPTIGGGRIVGACCHYVDLISYLTGERIKRVTAIALRSSADAHDEDTFVSLFELSGGSIGSLAFTSEGRRGFDVKEEIRITHRGHTARISDFRLLSADRSKYHYSRHRYGALNAFRAFLTARDEQRPVPVGLQDGIEATRITLALRQSIQNEMPVELHSGYKQPPLLDRGK